MTTNNGALCIMVALTWASAGVMGSYASLLYYVLRGHPDSQHDWKTRSRDSWMFGVAGCGVMIGMALLPLNIPLPACVLWFLQGLGSVGVLAAYEALSRYRKELWFGPEPKQPKNYVQE